LEKLGKLLANAFAKDPSAKLTNQQGYMDTIVMNLTQSYHFE